jgi:hypothetical protein
MKHRQHFLCHFVGLRKVMSAAAASLYRNLCTSLLLMQTDFASRMYRLSRLIDLNPLTLIIIKIVSIRKSWKEKYEFDSTRQTVWLPLTILFVCFMRVHKISWMFLLVNCSWIHNDRGDSHLSVWSPFTLVIDSSSGRGAYKEDEKGKHPCHAGCTEFFKPCWGIQVTLIRTSEKMSAEFWG